MKRASLVLALLWMVIVFIAYYWVKASEIIAYYLR